MDDTPADAPPPATPAPTPSFSAPPPPPKPASASKPSPAPPKATPIPTGSRIFASPLALRLAAEKGLDLNVSQFKHYHCYTNIVIR